jgi:hypothetical protein
MFQYPNPDKFMPSITTLNEWLKTKKNKQSFRPGLFETIGFSSDQIWAVISIIIELSALFLTLYGSWQNFLAKKNIGVLFAAVLIVILFIAFDIIGILLHDHNKPEKTIIRSKIKLLNNFPNAMIQLTKLYEQLNEITWREFVGFILLIVSGILKISAVYYLFIGRANIPVTIVIILFYLIVIYIHTFHTGYWISELRFRSLVKKEYDTWTNDLVKGLPSPYSILAPTVKVFTSPIQAFDNNSNRNSFQCGRQKIFFTHKSIDNNGNAIYHYTLESNGCLFDDDITPLIAPFNPIFANSLIEACIQLQFSQLGQLFIPGAISGTNPPVDGVNLSTDSNS